MIHHFINLRYQEQVLEILDLENDVLSKTNLIRIVLSLLRYGHLRW